MERSINEQQAAFAAAYALDPETAGNGAAAAIRAGYSENCARQTAYRLLRLPGIRAEIDRLNREAIGDYATASIHLLGRIVTDEKAPPKLRIDAAKTILDRAGLIAPKAEEAQRPADQKRLEQMSEQELIEFIALGRAAMAREQAEQEAAPLAIEAPATPPEPEPAVNRLDAYLATQSQSH